MDWNLSWLFRGGTAFLLTLINLIRTLLGRQKHWEILLFAALACGAVTLLTEFRMIDQWLRWGEWGFIERSVSSLSKTLTSATAVGLCGNLLILILQLKRRK